jgi:hypothetical protein
VSRPNLPEGDYVKVRLTDAGMVETLWAARVADGRFRLDNAPWFAYGVSIGDIVEATELVPGMFDFVRVVEPSGARTIRLHLAADADSSTPTGKQLLDGLLGLGCSYEGANRRFIAVTIPPPIDLAAIQRYLTTNAIAWESANPKYVDPAT